jgi:hypothetical protein
MNKLREQLEDCAIVDAIGEFNVDKAEEITDDFTMAFLEWLNENSIYYPKEKTYFFQNEWHSQEEIFKHFKNNIYGK